MFGVWSFLLPKIEKRIAPRIATANGQTIAKGIPAIIHQTFVSTDLPDRTFDAAQSWIDLNPEFEYRFYDDSDHVNLLEERFDKNVLAAYHKLPRGAFRADLWRYCILFQNGGIYADIDTVCQSSLRSALKADDAFVVPNTGTVPHAVFNAFICCSARHPILEKAIEYATQRILDAKSFDGYAMVGPGALGTAINLTLSREPRAAHEIGAHKEGEIAYRIIEKRAEEGEQPRRVISEGKTLLITKYDGYFEDLESAGITHWAAKTNRSKIMKKPIKAMKKLMK